MRRSLILIVVALAYCCPFSASEAQTITVKTSATEVGVNEEFIVTVEVIGSPTTPLFAAQAVLDLGAGFEVIGGTNLGVSLDSRWLTGVKTLPTPNQLDVAVTMGGSKEPCVDACRVVRIRSRYTTSGSKQIRFNQFLTTAVEPVTLQEVTFSDFIEPPAITVSGGATTTDTTPPVITLKNPSLMSVEAGGTYVEPGATATDDVDGAVEVEIGGDVVEPGLSVGTVFDVTYDAIDVAGNLAQQVVRTVTIIDTIPPQITRNNPEVGTVEAGSAYIDPGASAIDIAEGVVAVVTSGDTVDPAAPVGTVFVVAYDAVDSSGNIAVQVTRSITVVDTTGPVITLLGQESSTVVQGEVFDDPGATAFDNADGVLTVTVGGSTVDTLAAIGTNFIITYDAVDSSGNHATQLMRTVVIVPADTIPGDFSGDGKVDATDFLALLNGWGTTYNSSHFLDLLNNWGVGI